jgi:hypothetical protein
MARDYERDTVQSDETAAFPDQPPHVPDIHRHFEARHALAVLLLAALPLVAAVGLLDTRVRVAEAGTPDRVVRVEYPGRIRATHGTTLRVEVTDNTHADAAASARVTLPAGYLRGFHVGRITPDPIAVGVVEISPDAAAGSPSVRVDVELEARRFGVHQGEIRVTHARGEPLTVPIRTFIFP